MIYAQILNNIVKNIITLNDISLIPTFSVGFDYFIEIDTLTSCPNTGWYYDGTNFSPIICFPVDGGYPPEIPTGSATNFIPFNLSTNSSSFAVSLNGTVINIGCQQYDYVWLRYVIYMFKIQEATIINLVTKTDTGLTYNGQFNIIQSDVDLIYTALCTLL